MTKVTSSSALATLTVSATLLEKDILLHLICKLASPLQLTLVVLKKGSSSDLSLSLCDGTILLVERNAILRSLCGMALHNALDNAPYYFLGGHSATAAASPVSAMALAGIASWQSVAASVTPESAPALADQLDAYLETRAFLVPSASCTLADMDLYLALVAALGDQVVPTLVHTRRWMQQCHATLANYANQVTTNGVSLTIPTNNMVGGAEHSSMPVFFYGTEGEFVPAATKKASTAPPTQQQPTKVNPAVTSTTQNSPTTATATATNNDAGLLTEEQKKAAAEKRAKKAAEKAAKKPKQPTPAAGDATELDISALDIRVGQIVKAWHHPDAEKLFCEEINVGESEPRKIASGLRPFYTSDDLLNRKVLVLCNLKARNLVGFPSHGMVLCASNDDHTQVEFVVPPDNATIGERVMFEGYTTGEPEAENKVAKKKLFELLSPDLKTNTDGIVVWKNAKAMTSAGPVVALNGMPNAHVS